MTRCKITMNGGVPPDLPPATETAVARMLAKAPEQRFPNAEQFVMALAGTTTAQAAPSSPQQAASPALTPKPSREEAAASGARGIQARTREPNGSRHPYRPDVDKRFPRLLPGATGSASTGACR